MNDKTRRSPWSTHLSKNTRQDGPSFNAAHHASERSQPPNARTDFAQTSKSNDKPFSRPEQIANLEGFEALWEKVQSENQQKTQASIDMKNLLLTAKHLAPTEKTQALQIVCTSIEEELEFAKEYLSDDHMEATHALQNVYSGLRVGNVLGMNKEIREQLNNTLVALADHLNRPYAPASLPRTEAREISQFLELCNINHFHVEPHDKIMPVLS